MQATMQEDRLEERVDEMDAKLTTLDKQSGIHFAECVLQRKQVGEAITTLTTTVESLRQSFTDGFNKIFWVTIAALGTSLLAALVVIAQTALHAKP